MAKEETVLRFDLHQRLQHGLMASSFILLVLTGWPLSTHGIGASHSLVALFGGHDGCALVHRIAAIVLIVASVYHLGYLMMLFFRGKLRPAMVPGPQDAKHAVQNILYFVGLRKTRPNFPRFTYFEKFDYWAVFWGVLIMVGSGFVRWFPALTVKYLPPWVYEIAHFAHADEAILAGLAIFVWHFYNVHLRPGIFPMSKVFLTGRLTMSELEHEHPAEYAELMEKRAATDERKKQ